MDAVPGSSTLVISTVTVIVSSMAASELPLSSFPSLTATSKV